MSKRLIQDLHAAISRRDWSAVETAANRLRNEVEQTVAILAGTGVGSLPNDYPLSELAAVALSPSPETNAAGNDFEALAKQIEEAERPASGGPWCDGYEPIENRDYFAKMVRNFAENLPSRQTREDGQCAS